MPYIFPPEHVLSDLFKTVQDFVEFIAIRNAQEEGIRNIELSMGQARFNKEMRTLRIGLPRRSGNTTLALMIFQHYPSSILIVQDQNSARELERRPELQSCNGKSRIYSKRTHVHYSQGRENPSVVIADIFGYLTELEQQNIFNINSKAFIFLG